MLACGLGMLSPLLLLVHHEVREPIPIARSPGAAPKAPSFRYEKPLNFDLAEPGQFVVAARRSISAARADRPMLFSEDSRLLAYCPAATNRAAVSVIEVDSLTETASFLLREVPTHLAWSPDLRKLFFIIAGDQGRIGILNLDTRSVTELPQPKNRELPDGPPVWWLSRHVALFPSAEPPLDLDLDTLQLTPLAESPAYKATVAAKEEATKEKSSDSGKFSVPQAPQLQFPASSGSWRLAIDGCIQSVQSPPRRTPAQSWTFGGFATLAFIKDEGRQARQWLPETAFQQGDIVLPAPDGSKVVYHRGNQTEVIFFGIRAAVPGVITIKMPLSREKKKDDAELEQLIKEQRLCAFAYAPMTNPLTGKVVGPDREHVRAVLRLTRWQDETASFWMAERLQDVSVGDVVADLHIWEGGRLVPATSYASDRWWEPIANPPQNDAEAVPTLVKSDELDQGISVQSLRQAYAFQFQSLTHNTHAPQPRVPAKKPEPAKVPATTNLPKPEVYTKTRDLKDEIEKFVFEHHRKASEPNVLMFCDDYDDNVDYLGKPRSRESIRLDEIDYHDRWDRVNEEPQRPFGFNITDESRPVVRYTVRFRTENSKGGRWVNGENDLELTLRRTSRGFVITKETAGIHDRKEGSLAADADALPLPSLNKPRQRWTGSFHTKENPNLVMNDELELSEGKSRLFRTYQFKDKAGRVEKQCRAEFSGSYADLGNVIQFDPNRVSWTAGGAPDLINALRQSADDMIGQSFKFNSNGDDLSLTLPGGTTVILRRDR